MYTDPSGHLFGIDDLTIAVLVASMAKGAAIGAGVGGAMAAATGGDIGQGMLTGAISGACFGGVGAIAHAGQIGGVAGAAMHASAGAVSGGIGAGITGGNIGQGMMIGGLAGGISAYAGSEFLPMDNEFAQSGGRMMIGGTIGGTISAFSGGNFASGFAQGATSALLGDILNCAVQRAEQMELAQMIFAEDAEDYNVPDSFEAVGSVARNRVMDGRFGGNTYKDVIEAKINGVVQFKSWGSDLWDSFNDPSSLQGNNRLAYSRSLTVAKDVYFGKIADPTGGALYFWRGTSPSPGQINIGNHIFR